MKIIKLMQEYVELQSIATLAIDEGILSDENVKSVKEFLSFLDQDVEIIKTEEVKPTSYSASIKMIEVSKASDAIIPPIPLPPKKKKSYRKQLRAIETWIIENDIKQFTPEEFLNTRGKYPVCKLNLTISALIDENKIIQWHDGSFKVSNKFKELVQKE